MSARKGNRTNGDVQWRWLIAFLATSGWVLVPGLTPFASMCGIAISLFAVIKLHILTHYRKFHNTAGIHNIVAWFIAWPGLDPDAFFQTKAVDRPRISEWGIAAAKTCFGCWMLFLVAPKLRDANELLCGWVALIGIAFLLHFGSFHLAALFWRHCGRNVKPIMNAPILACSVSEFWSRRWNLAFRDYASPFLFVPLMRRTNPVMAVLLGYTFSGLVHELAISVPARAGYGLPTLYFLLQGLAMLLERTLAKRDVRITNGIRGWAWTAAVTVPAAYFLFHPPFIRAIVLPVVDVVVLAN